MVPLYFDYPMTNKNRQCKCPTCGTVFKRLIYVYRDLCIKSDGSRCNYNVAYCFKCKGWKHFI